MIKLGGKNRIIYYDHYTITQGEAGLALQPRLQAKTEKTNSTKHPP